MTMQQITLRLPKETLRQFDRAVQSQGQARSVVLTQLVQEYIHRVAQAREIGRMTLAALEIKSPRARAKRKFDSHKIARALEQIYGTRDGVELVNLNRDRWISN